MKHRCMFSEVPRYSGSCGPNITEKVVPSVKELADSVAGIDMGEITRVVATLEEELRGIMHTMEEELREVTLHDI